MLFPHHYQQLIDRGFTRGQIDSFEQGIDQPWVVKSLDVKEIQKEWLCKFPLMRGQESDALLLRFNKTTFSLRPDHLVIDGDRFSVCQFTSTAIVVLKDDLGMGERHQTFIS